MSNEAENSSIPAQQNTAETAAVSLGEVNPDPGSENNDSTTPPEIDKLQRILSIRVPIIIKIAEKTMPLENVLKLNIGSIIQFDKDAYQHIELMVNNHTIGLGQPIKIGENFGLRIAHIGDITDTIKNLGGQQDIE